MAREIAAAWFLYSGDGKPLGQLYRGMDDAAPAVGHRFAHAAESGEVEVVEFTELRQSCGYRRFRVVVRAVG